MSRVRAEGGSAPGASLDCRAYWEQPLSCPHHLATTVRMHRELWDAVYRRSRVPEMLGGRVAGLACSGGPSRLLVSSGDRCGDAADLVPLLARFAGPAEAAELRVPRRDAHPALMDRYLTGGSRSIPMVIALDEDFEQVGRWGPRPLELQDRILTEKRDGLRSGRQIYRDARARYVRDGGSTTLGELLDVLEGALAVSP